MSARRALHSWGHGDPKNLQKPIFTFAAREGVEWALSGGLMRFSPDGKKLLGVIPNGGVLVRDMASGVERSVVPQLKSMQRVEWAHDSGSFLIGGTGTDGKTGLYRVDESSGKAVLIASERLARFFEPSRDGKTVYYWAPLEKRVLRPAVASRPAE